MVGASPYSRPLPVPRMVDAKVALYCLKAGENGPKTCAPGAARYSNQRPTPVVVIEPAEALKLPLVETSATASPAPDAEILPTTVRGPPACTTRACTVLLSSVMPLASRTRTTPPVAPSCPKSLLAPVSVTSPAPALRVVVPPTVIAPAVWVMGLPLGVIRLRLPVAVRFWPSVSAAPLVRLALLALKAPDSANAPPDTRVQLSSLLDAPNVRLDVPPMVLTATLCAPVPVETEPRANDCVLLKLILPLVLLATKVLTWLAPANAVPAAEAVFSWFAKMALSDAPVMDLPVPVAASDTLPRERMAATPVPPPLLSVMLPPAVTEIPPPRTSEPGEPIRTPCVALGLSVTSPPVLMAMSLVNPVVRPVDPMATPLVEPPVNVRFPATLRFRLVLVGPTLPPRPPTRAPPVPSPLLPPVRLRLPVNASVCVGAVM